MKLPEEGSIMLMFGFLKPYKRVHVGLEVLKEVRAEVEDAYLFIAGGLSPGASKKDRTYEAYLYKLIKELDLSDNVIFPNRFFPDDEIASRHLELYKGA